MGLWGSAGKQGMKRTRATQAKRVTMKVHGTDAESVRN